MIFVIALGGIIVDDVNGALILHEAPDLVPTVRMGTVGKMNIGRPCNRAAVFVIRETISHIEQLGQLTGAEIGNYIQFYPCGRKKTPWLAGQGVMAILACAVAVEGIGIADLSSAVLAGVGSAAALLVLPLVVGGEREHCPRYLLWCGVHSGSVGLPEWSASLLPPPRLSSDVHTGLP